MTMLFHRRLLCPLYLCLLIGQTGSHITSQTWKFDPKIHDKTIRTDLLATIQPATRVSCARKCSLINTCRSFFFTQDTGNCRLHSNRYAKGAPQTDMVDSPGTKFYTDQCTAYGYVYNERVDKYFKLKMNDSSKNTNRSSARDACVADGGLLSRVKTIDDVNAVTQAYNAALKTPMSSSQDHHFGFWLDATFDVTRQQFTWSDGTVVDTSATGVLNMDGLHSMKDKLCVVMMLKSTQGVGQPHTSSFKLRPGKCDKHDDTTVELYPLCQCWP